MWVGLAMAFNLGVWWFFGLEWAMLFFAGFALEEMLSIDNLFVFLLIFKSFRTPLHLQHRALLYGVLMSIVLRALFIVFGTILLGALPLRIWLDLCTDVSIYRHWLVCRALNNLLVVSPHISLAPRAVPVGFGGVWGIFGVQWRQGRPPHSHPASACDPPTLQG